MADDFTIFSGTANSNLAEAIASELVYKRLTKTSLLGNCAIERFPDGEISVQLNESPLLVRLCARQKRFAHYL